MMANLRILKIAATHSLSEFFAIYPLRVYLIAWLPRIVTQLGFFVLLANFVGGPSFFHYALIGNAVYLLVLTSNSAVTASVTWEQRAGTLPLLIASPSNPLLVLSGRNFGMALHSYLSGVIGLLVIGPLLGMPLGLEKVLVILLLLLLISLSTYGLGLLLGSIALRARGFHNVLSNSVSLVMLAICGVNIPQSTLPEMARMLSHLFPMTHGLQAIRYTIDGAATHLILEDVLLELLVGLAYFTVAQFLFYILLARSRRQGTLEIY